MRALNGGSVSAQRIKNARQSNSVCVELVFRQANNMVTYIGRKISKKRSLTAYNALPRAARTALRAAARCALLRACARICALCARLRM